MLTVLQIRGAAMSGQLSFSTGLLMPMSLNQLFDEAELFEGLVKLNPNIKE